MEGGRRILLDNSRVYVRFHPFVSNRVRLGRMDTGRGMFDAPSEPRNDESAPPTFPCRRGQNPNPRLSTTPLPRWTLIPLFYSQSTDLPVLRGRRCDAGHRKGPRPVSYKINLRFRRFCCRTGHTNRLSGHTFDLLFRRHPAARRSLGLTISLKWAPGSDLRPSARVPLSLIHI